MYKTRVVLVVSLTLAITVALAAAQPAGELYVGWASRSITPNTPVALAGQMYMRIANEVLDPVTCTALALETRDGDKVIDQAILVSCDVVSIQEGIQSKVREAVKSKLAEFDAKKLILNATHTHTAPVMQTKNRYEIPKEGVTQPGEFVEFMVKRVAEAAVEAWQNRRPGGFSWGLGHAVVGHNRRMCYFNGSAVMYGKTDKPEFSHVEGYEDASVEMLFFWDHQDKLTGIVINLACPAQETENMSQVSADFWHEVRQELRKRYSDDLFILPQCGAAGDQSPHLQLHQKDEQVMRERKGVSRRQEIASRIAGAVDEVFPYVKERKYIKEKVVFQHLVDEIELPAHKEGKEPVRMELHVLRLDDVAMATNPFELYMDYGMRIKGRSKAVMTMIVQLACDSCRYLPTARAIAGGGYSAEWNFQVGPQGGQILVEETLKRIDSLWQ